MLKESYTLPKSLESEDIISLSTVELALIIRKRLNPIILDITMIQPNFQKFLLGGFWWISNHLLAFYTIIISRKWDLNIRCWHQLQWSLRDLPHTVTTKGMITLNDTLGSDPTSRTKELQFYAVDLQSVYNAIMGIPAHKNHLIWWFQFLNRLNFQRSLALV